VGDVGAVIGGGGVDGSCNREGAKGIRQKLGNRARERRSKGEGGRMESEEEEERVVEATRGLGGDG